VLKPESIEPRQAECSSEAPADAVEDSRKSLAKRFFAPINYRSSSVAG
jgi:hypothetical protein